MYVVHQIEGYYKLDITYGEETVDADQRDLDEKEIGEYVKVIKKCCFDIDAEELLISCLKNMQYFTKENWRKLKETIEQLLAIAETEEDRQKIQSDKLMKQELVNLNEQIEEKSQFIRKLMK